MADHTMRRERTPAVQRPAHRLGFGSALLLALAAAAAFGIAITTAPPRSGPFCLVDPCITYPYTDAAAFVPIDYLWMYPALLLGPLFMLVTAYLHAQGSAERRIFSLVGLSFAAIAAAILTMNYFVQLTVMQPSLLRGEVAGLEAFSQYNPHGVFIALEDIGYILMSVAFLFVASTIEPHDRPARLARALFFSSGMLSLGSLLVLAVIYGYDLEYRYEVAAITITWIALSIGGVLLSLSFWRGPGEEGR